MSNSEKLSQDVVQREVAKYMSLILAYQNPNFDPNHLVHQFDDLAADWSYANAVCLAKAAVLAYERPEVIKLEVDRIPQAIQFKYFEGYDTHTQAFALAFNETIIVSFRGTETEDSHAQIKDLLTDSKFELVDFISNGSVIEGAQVHTGFQAALDEIWHDLLLFIEENSNVSRKKIWLTGHSLGGALATVATARLITDSRFSESVIGGLYTIGQPRVGNQVFAEIISTPLQENRVARLVNNNNLVTMLPLTKMGYWHICGRRYINDKGELTHNMSDKLIEKDRVKGRARWLFSFVLTLLVKRFGLKIKIPSIIVDHDKFNYLTLIKKAKQRKKLFKDQEFEQKPLSGLIFRNSKKNNSIV